MKELLKLPELWWEAGIYGRKYIYSNSTQVSFRLRFFNLSAVSLETKNKGFNIYIYPGFQMV